MHTYANQIKKKVDKIAFRCYTTSINNKALKGILMQNTYTTTARCAVRQILQNNNIKFNYNIYTNKCAELGKRNLCFTVASMSDSVLQQIRAAINVKSVYTTQTSHAHYLRVEHCSYKPGV